MIKEHAQDDQEHLFKACGGHMNFLLDADSRIKSAASEVISKQLVQQFLPPKGHFAQHMIIMGDGEAYGANRNGDFWSKKACVDRHPTFVSHGAYYREHRHRSKDQSIGEIKYAAHNPKMQRTELIVWGNIKKAEDIFESLKKGEARSNSMSARVAYDTCNCCAQKSPSPAVYCKHAAKQMNQWVPEFNKYAYVDNPNPTFFDASDVGYPADRIAHYLEYAFPDAEMRKSASANNYVVNGAEWAKFSGICIPDAPELQLTPWQNNLLEKLASHEQWIANSFVSGDAYRSLDAKLAFVREISPKLYNRDLNDSEISELRNLRPQTFFGKMASAAAILPFRTFLAYVQGRTMDDLNNDPAVKLAATEVLPRVFRKLVKDGCACCALNPQIFNGNSEGTVAIDPNVNDPVSKLLTEMGHAYTVNPEAVKKRAVHITITKSGSYSPANYRENSNVENNSAEFLAGIYGMYKLAALQDMYNRGIFISEPIELLLTANNSYQQ